MNKAMVIALVCSFYCVSAQAQTACPMGVAAGSAQCGPSPVQQQQQIGPQQQPTIRYVPIGRWRTTWGAVATDEATSSVGTSVDMRSESAARREALRRCKKPDAKKCEVRLAYENQCVALAWPDGPGRLGLESGPGLQTVREEAREICKKNGGGNCRIVYSECTDNVFEKF